MKKDKKFIYFYSLSKERLRFFLSLTPEERLNWLEDAHDFVKSIVSIEKIKTWKLYINKGGVMEKGKLEIIKTKKGEYVVNVVYPDGKKQTISDLRLKDNSLNGKQVDVIRDKGQILKIIHEGKEIYSKEKNKHQSPQRQQKSNYREKKSHKFKSI